LLLPVISRQDLLQGKEGVSTVARIFIEMREGFALILMAKEKNTASEKPTSACAIVCVIAVIKESKPALDRAYLLQTNKFLSQISLPIFSPQIATKTFNTN
jgi:hypothetical protein